MLPVQTWALHTVVLGHRAQAPDPLQAPLWPHVVMSVWLQSPNGSWPLGTAAQEPAPLHWLHGRHSFIGSEPEFSGEQVPNLVGTLHAWQVPVQAVLQQYPSIQKPLWHMVALEHGSPLGFLVVQAEPLQ